MIGVFSAFSQISLLRLRPIASTMIEARVAETTAINAMLSETVAGSEATAEPWSTVDGFGTELMIAVLPG